MLRPAMTFIAVHTGPNGFRSLRAAKACTFQSCCLKTQSLECFLALARIFGTQGLNNCLEELKYFPGNIQTDRASGLYTSWYLISVSDTAT